MKAQYCSLTSLLHYIWTCLLSFLLPACSSRSSPYLTCPVEYDHAAASSALAVHCISGEMNRVPCSSFWLTTKVLLVFISEVQWSRKMEPYEAGLCQNKHLCICVMVHIQILLLSAHYVNVGEVRLWWISLCFRMRATSIVLKPSSKGGV